MKISYKGDYALKAVLDLTLNYEGEVVSAADMAKRIDAPVKFLEQVLSELKKGGFIQSKRGKVGGYCLARSPEKISLGEVIRYLDGPIEPISCTEKGYSNCRDTAKCIFRKIWCKVAVATSEIVDNVTFREIANELQSKNRILNYTI